MNVDQLVAKGGERHRIEVGGMRLDHREFFGVDSSASGTVKTETGNWILGDKPRDE